MALPFSCSPAPASWLAAGHPAERPLGPPPASQTSLSSRDPSAAPCSVYTSALSPPASQTSLSASRTGFPVSPRTAGTGEKATHMRCAQPVSLRSGCCEGNSLHSGNALPGVSMHEVSALSRSFSGSGPLPARSSPPVGAQDSREAQFSAKATELQHLLHLFQNAGEPKRQEAVFSPSLLPSFASPGPSFGERKRKVESGEACTLLASPQGDALPPLHGPTGLQNMLEREAFLHCLARQRLGDSLRFAADNAGSEFRRGDAVTDAQESPTAAPPVSLLTQHRGRGQLPLSLRPVPSAWPPHAAVRPPTSTPALRSQTLASAASLSMGCRGFQGDHDPRLSKYLSLQDRRAASSPVGMSPQRTVSSQRPSLREREGVSVPAVQKLQMSPREGMRHHRVSLPPFAPPGYGQEPVREEDSFPDGGGEGERGLFLLRSALLASPDLVEKIKRLPGGVAALQRCAALTGPPWNKQTPLRNEVHAARSPSPLSSLSASVTPSLSPAAAPSLLQKAAPARASAACGGAGSRPQEGLRREAEMAVWGEQQSQGDERKKRRKTAKEERVEQTGGGTESVKEKARPVFTCGVETDGAEEEASGGRSGEKREPEETVKLEDDLQKEERREKRLRRRMRRRQRRLRRRARRDLVRLMRRQLLKKREDERRSRDAEESQDESEEEKPCREDSRGEKEDEAEADSQEDSGARKRGAKPPDSEETQTMRGRRRGLATTARGKGAPTMQRPRRGLAQGKAPEATHHSSAEEEESKIKKGEEKETKNKKGAQEERKNKKAEEEEERKNKKAEEEEEKKNKKEEEKEKKNKKGEEEETKEEDFNAQRERIERKLRKRLKQLSSGTVMVQRGSRRREGDYEAGLSLQRKLDFLVEHSVACPTLPNSAPLSNAYTITSRFKERNHSSMLSDAARMNLYKLAIETQVSRLLQEDRKRDESQRPHRVLEVGCGPFCVLSINAARAGAKDIVALEVVKRSAADAQAFVRMYGFDRVIKVINAYSKECPLRRLAPLSPCASSSGNAEAVEPRGTACAEKKSASPDFLVTSSTWMERSTSSCLSSPSSESVPPSASTGSRASASLSTCSARDDGPEESVKQTKGEGERGQDGHGPFDLIIHEIIGDICSNEGVADVVDDIQTRTGSIPASVPYAARTWFTPCELPRPRHILFPHHRYPLRTILSPNRVLLQSVDMEFSSLRLSDSFAPLEELLFEEPMRPQLLQKRRAEFRCMRSGKLCGLLLCNEVEVLKGVSIDNRESSAASHWYTNVALLRREVRVRRGDTIVVYSCADLRNYQHVDVKEGGSLADVEEIHWAARPGRASPSSAKAKQSSSSTGRTASRSRRSRCERVASRLPVAAATASSPPAPCEESLRRNGPSREGERGQDSASSQLYLSSPSREEASARVIDSGERRASLSGSGETAYWTEPSSTVGGARSAGDFGLNSKTEEAERTASVTQQAGDQRGSGAGDEADDPLAFPAFFATSAAGEERSIPATGYTRQYLSRPRFCFCVEIHRPVRRRSRSSFLFLSQFCRSQGERGEPEREAENLEDSKWRALLESETDTSSSEEEADSDLSDSDFSSDDSDSSESEEEEEGEDEAEEETDAAHSHAATGEANAGGKARTETGAGGEDSEDTAKKSRKKHQTDVISASENEEKRREETEKKEESKTQAEGAGMKKLEKQEMQVKIQRLPAITIDFNEQSPFVDKAVCKGRAGGSGRQFRL
ncbi:hypothetical protein TGPRC2_212140 [Toxoplasma gondii TgCatPRC2]|uniref:Uncharacterized protein n=2 Tax=Toxoplasma gondii TaxID=5811 RepID=A0A151HQF8_TOXGO|nr:hypothetical protein TGDOM2_212140 [Toxoplasma gondii GAB2-2007-GAL-DOM2]KYK71627.1 hypothetical protein TGPRC2_212140 [Toxoplasma gondii TgCatPRC2]